MTTETKNKYQKQKNWRQRHLLKGLCIYCNEKLVTKYACEFHRKKVNEYQKAQRKTKLI